jgi:hypothetical protein
MTISIKYFDLLLEQAKKTPLTKEEQIKLSKALMRLTENTSNDDLVPVYILIVHFYQSGTDDKERKTTEKKGKKAILPYMGKNFEGGKGAIFVISKLPPRLQNILYNHVFDPQ